MELMDKLTRVKEENVSMKIQLEQVKGNHQW